MPKSVDHCRTYKVNGIEVDQIYFGVEAARDLYDDWVKSWGINLVKIFNKKRSEEHCPKIIDGIKDLISHVFKDLVSIPHPSLYFQELV